MWSARRWRTRLLTLVASTVAALFLIEAALWILHFALSPERRASELAPKPGERRIVCVGDSNTFGVHLDASASYPGRLQAYLDRAAGQPWRVVNLGYPGQNTAQVRGRLSENLEAYRPEIVCLWAGVNNSWSPAMRHLWDSPDGESSPATLESVVQQVRIFKLARMLLAPERDTRRPRKRTARAGQGDVPGLDGAQRGEGLGEVESVLPGTKSEFSAEEVRRHTEMDLVRILALCREHDARLVIADYPVDGSAFDTVNPVLERFAREHGIPLVPLHERVLPLVSELGGRRMMFSDGHATSLGNFEVARCFLETLIEAGLIERRPEWDELPSARRIAVEGHLGFVDRVGSKVRIEVLYEPFWQCELALVGTASMSATARLNANGSAWIEVELPIEVDLPEGDAGATWRAEATLTPPAEVDAQVKSLPAIALPPVTSGLR